jgi:K+-transporting ATPase c subunit
MTTETETNKINTLWTPDQKIQAFKEIVTAILGGLILLCTLILAGATFSYVGDPAKIKDAKDILQVLLGVAGVVVGYYFGRIPADARAAQSQEQANDANSHADNMSAQNQAMADEVDQMMDKLNPPVGGEKGLISVPGNFDIGPDLKRLRDKLRAQSTVGRKRR